MSNITIADINSNGSNLFMDSESYLHELNEQEITDILGGVKIQLLWSSLCVEW